MTGTIGAEIFGVDLQSNFSDAILAQIQDAFAAHQVRFRWQPGSLAFWDNRCTRHRAVWDYYPAVRSGFRVTLAGEVPE